MSYLCLLFLTIFGKNAMVANNRINCSSIATAAFAHSSTMFDANFLYDLIAKGKSPWLLLASISKLHILYGTRSSLLGCASISLITTLYSKQHVVFFSINDGVLLIITQPVGLIFFIWKNRNIGGMCASYNTSDRPSYSYPSLFKLKLLYFWVDEGSSLSHSLYQKFLTLLKVAIFLNVNSINV